MSQVDFFARERGEAAHRMRLDENENSHPTPLLTFPFCMSTALSVKEKNNRDLRILDKNHWLPANLYENGKIVILYDKRKSSLLLLLNRKICFR